MNNLLVTTTHSVEGKEIKKYFTPISATSVIGTNALSELKASFTDFFGGRSSTFEKRFQQLYDIAIGELKQKAMAIGANAIVGLQVNTGEINGKSTQMFQISLYGTPVLFAGAGGEVINHIVDGKKVDDRIRVRRILEQEYIPYKIFTDETFKLIENSSFPELLPLILKGIERYSDESIILNEQEKSKSEAMPFFYQYFVNISDTDEILKLYEEFKKSEDVKYLNILLKVIVYNNKVDFEKVKELLLSESITARKFALRFLGIGKDNYILEDISNIEEMKKLVTNSFPAIGKRSTQKKMFSSAEKDVWECVCGKVNEVADDYCKSCGNDIYGISPKEIKPKTIVHLLEERISVIKEINNQQ